MTGYVCKKCGAPSPTGVGYADSTVPADTSAALTQCACGYSVSTLLDHDSVTVGMRVTMSNHALPVTVLDREVRRGRTWLKVVDRTGCGGWSRLSPNIRIHPHHS